MFASTQVLSAPATSFYKLQHELNVNTYRQIQIEVQAAYELLSSLLDREILLRRQIDISLDDQASYDSKLDLEEPHHSEGQLFNATRVF